MEIFALLESIEDILENSKEIPFVHKSIVNKEEMLDIIKEIRLKLPEELKQAKVIKEEHDRIISKAEEEGTEPPDLEPVELVYMGSTTERGLGLVLDALRPVRDELIARIDGGQLMLVTGNTMDVFGTSIRSDWDLELAGLGLFDTHAEYKMLKRHNSMFLGSFEDMEIVGFKSLFGFFSCGKLRAFVAVNYNSLIPGIVVYCHKISR